MRNPLVVAKSYRSTRGGDGYYEKTTAMTMTTMKMTTMTTTTAMMNENLRMTTPERKKFLFQGKGGRNRKNFFLVLERLEAGKETVRKNCYSRTRKTDRRTNEAQWFRTAKHRSVRSLTYSRASGKEYDSMIQNDLVLSHSAEGRTEGRTEA